MRVLSVLPVLLTSFIFKFALAANCDEDLLGENDLPDSAFTATSNSETVEQPIAGVSPGVDHSAKTARDMPTGGWCPSRKVSTNLTEYIQVDMKTVNVITKIAFGPRSGVAYTPSFVIRYKREENDGWRDYKMCSSNSTLIISGVESNLDLKLISLNPPIVARWVRIYPYSQKPMFVCAKFQFYGCRFSDELVEYKIPGGSDFNSNSYGSGLVNLRDVCYEGQRDPRGGVLHNGLGCLSDSRVSTSTKAFDLSPWEHDSERSEAAAVANGDCLVGWNRSRWEEARRSPSPAVDLVYRFSGLRTFQALHLYALNLPVKKIRIPRRIEASFSIDGTTFPSTSDISSDVHSYAADPLIIDLNAKSGRAVQLKLFFADEWIVLSETRFISVAGKENELAVKVAKEGSAGLPASENVNPPSSSSLVENNRNEESDHDSNYNPNLEPEEEIEVNESQNPIHDANGGPIRVIESPPYQGPTMLILILVFLCCFMLLLVGIACFSISWMKNRRKKRQQSMREDMQSASGKQFKSHSNSSGLFKWPGLTLTTGGNSNLTGASQPSFDNGMGYVTVPNNDPGQFFAYSSVPSTQNGELTDSRPLAKRLFSSVAAKLFRSKGKARILTPTSHQYEQVVAQSSHSSPSVNPNAANPIFQSQQSAPSFPVTSLPVHTANGVIQIDLKRSNPTLIVNGHPLLQYQQTQQQYQQQQHQGTESMNRGANYFPTFSNRQPESSVVYQSVQGESDADSLAASTMSPEYASASLLGGQTGSGIPYMAGMGGWGVGDYSTTQRQLVDVSTSTQAIMQPPFYVPQSSQQQQQQQNSAAVAAAYAWTSPNGAFIQRSLSQQQFHQPFWAPQTVSQGVPMAHEVASSTHSGESSSDQFSSRLGNGSNRDPSSTIYGFTGQST
ncbi:unnamed protein product [Hymenolepis diminuta]|uniref:F5/8 type C domain-containing protein n=1 Tax=Hymenolepis diminuta TaxID=6216 RepID=A0A158QDG5_HYMDI|nr:unnamed protein product [Hymenolepis diminuta]VUZ52037.1 unnamed protein product [Hymenolepis diminuta]